jgi:glycosyltransferase involved in cell wall biosynthesis
MIKNKLTIDYVLPRLKELFEKFENRKVAITKPYIKILVFVEHFPPRLGSDRRIFEIMKRLSRYQEVHFLVFPSIRILRTQTHILNNKVEILQRDTSTVYEGIIGHFLGMPYFLAIMWRLSLSIAYVLTLPLLLIKTIKILAEVKPNIIVLNHPSPYTGLLGYISGKIWRKPIVLDFNDLIAQYIITLFNFKRDSFKSRMLIYIQNYLAKKSHRVVVPTSFIEKYAVLNGVSIEKIKLIPNGVDIETFNPEKYDKNAVKKELGLVGEKLCLYFGRLESWAGINIILKLCKLTNNLGLNIKFILVGNREQKIPLMKNMIIYDQVPHEKIPRIISAADVVLIPFPNNEVSRAASPLKLFEAMAMQKIVIASRVDGIKDVVSDGYNGFLCDPNNIEEWLTKILSALNNNNELMHVCLKARRTVEEKYNWNILAEQFAEVIYELVAYRKHINKDLRNRSKY